MSKRHSKAWISLVTIVLLNLAFFLFAGPIFRTVEVPLLVSFIVIGVVEFSFVLIGINVPNLFISDPLPPPLPPAVEGVAEINIKEIAQQFDSLFNGTTFWIPFIMLVFAVFNHVLGINLGEGDAEAIYNLDWSNIVQAVGSAFVIILRKFNFMTLFNPIKE